MELTDLVFWEAKHVMQYLGCTRSVAYKEMKKLDQYTMGKLRVKSADFIAAMEASKIEGSNTRKVNAQTFSYKHRRKVA